ncbi:hypothetical protein Scep_006906 [Stephania cephalantha]|uniref:Uncharacterized protein n=1 Tax=Stephania cephalantha TaxID=152367 RepID=A0AAP0PMP1_9MAGN
MPVPLSSSLLSLQHHLLMFNSVRDANKGLRRFKATPARFCRHEGEAYKSGSKASGIPSPKKRRALSLAMWVEKGPDKDRGGEGDGDKEEGMMMRKRSRVRLTPFLSSIMTKKLMLSLSKRGDLSIVEMGKREVLNREKIREVKGDDQSKVEHAQNELDVFPTFTMGASSSHQPSNLFRLFFGELKATVENILDCIEDILVSLDGGTWIACSKDIAKKTKSSRHVIKEFVGGMNPMVDECDRAFYEHSVRKKWKCKSYPHNVNLDAD